MDKVEYEALLNKFYGGTLKTKERYLNGNAVLKHKCDVCSEWFYGKPLFMVGSESQRHLCGFSMGVNGEKAVNVKTSRNVHKKKGKQEEQPESIWERFSKMIWEDYTYQEIATKLQVNPTIIKDYFETEGLI